MQVVVYTQSNCAPCATVKRYLDSKEIPYEEYDRETPEYKAMVEETGISTTPVVKVGDKYVQGPALNRIRELYEGRG